MRLFPGSIQTISTALAEGDMKLVPLSEIPPGMRAKETEAWGDMMGGARKGFDAVADMAASGATPAQGMGVLGETMRNCVACDQTYRLVEE